MKRYHYTECGLDNVVIVGANFLTADDGEEVIVIPAAGKLHKAIAEGILKRDSAMSGKELRFLRTEMGMTQAQLAQYLHRDVQTVARWEKGEVSLDGNAETLVRLLASEKLQIPLDTDMTSLSRWSTPSAGARNIIIEARGGSYYPKAA